MILKTLLAFVASTRNGDRATDNPTFSQSTADDLESRGVKPNPFEIGVALNTFYDVHIPEHAMWNVQFDLDPDAHPTHEEIVAKLHQEMLELQRTYDEDVHRTAEGRLANLLLELGDRRLAIQRRIRARIRYSIRRLTTTTQLQDVSA